jgi:mycoredoxin
MQSTDSNEIVVFWRPGCIFCSSLLRQLDRSGVEHRPVNIWDDPAAAAQVRAAANGNETVPTVVVGPVVAVNPDVNTVVTLAAEHAPAAIPADYEPPQPGRFGRWLTARFGGTSDG